MTMLSALSACGGGGPARPVVVDIFGHSSELADPIRYERVIAAKTVLAATAQGLVAFDARGEVTGALAESWIVSDGGQSYIFRLRRAKWANGDPVKADVVARLLEQRMRACPDMMAGLKPEVRAMTDRVIEIRLDTALPAFIQLLAQPRLAIRTREGGTGPYVGKMLQRRLYLEPAFLTQNAADGDAAHAILPTERRTLQTGRPALVMARFQDGQSDLVLGGRFQDLPLIPATRLGATDVHADPAPGLFGFAIIGTSPFLADRTVRDALSRAIDRAQLAAALNLQGWTTTVTPVPAQLDLAQAPAVPDWAGASMDERLASAQAAVNAWKARHGASPVLRIALPAGSGATLLFHRLAADYGALGLRIERVAADAPADLKLIDEVAGFDSALWYLARLDCPMDIACDRDASASLDRARSAENPAQQSAMLSDAERLIVANAGYIPLGLPIRWSLVSRRLKGFTPSPRATHPLNSLLAAPN
ncbi:MAG: ABC transporter substrate-binding protein [Sphingobium sp.]|nr:ABC transporter substrate-binding protein [Sphingobium sp.]